MKQRYVQEEQKKCDESIEQDDEEHKSDSCDVGQHE